MLTKILLALRKVGSAIGRALLAGMEARAGMYAPSRWFDKEKK